MRLPLLLRHRVSIIGKTPMGIVCRIGDGAFASRAGGGNLAVSARRACMRRSAHHIALSHVRMNGALGLNAAFRSRSHNGRYGKTAAPLLSVSQTGRG